MHFNTSHVTVYLFFLSITILLSTLFQYIPCYCLSADYHNVARVALLFQYIPCYCLSPLTLSISRLPEEFQYIPCYCLSADYHNVARVALLFQYIPCYCLSPLTLSISRLPEEFQYIPCYCLSTGTRTSRLKDNKFQYIPCYCLSQRIMIRCYPLLNFNTSHVTVYPDCHGVARVALLFQYIPCYCLSNEFNPFLLQAPSSFPLFYAISTFFTSRL